MDDNVVLPLLKSRKLTREEMEQELRTIGTLRDQLVKVGYNQLEVNYMVELTSGRQDLRKLDRASLRRVRSSLEDQLAIARQCLKVVKDKP